jgi:hypothetical protein
MISLECNSIRRLAFIEVYKATPVLVDPVHPKKRKPTLNQLQLIQPGS